MTINDLAEQFLHLHRTSTLTVVEMLCTLNISFWVHIQKASFCACMKAGSPPAAAVVLRYNFPTLQTVLLHACMKVPTMCMDNVKTVYIVYLQVSSCSDRC